MGLYFLVSESHVRKNISQFKIKIYTPSGISVCFPVYFIIQPLDMVVGGFSLQKTRTVVLMEGIMQYIHIKNLEKYNPGYTDRNLIWCKVYFSMINSSYDFENMDDVDKWRLIALIMLELQIKKPIPYDVKWLQKKISNNKRPMSLTLKMLHNFIEFVTLEDENLYPREEESRLEEKRKEKNRIDKEFDIEKEFEIVWGKYPNKDGKAKALLHFIKTVNTTEDLANIHIALDKYLDSKKVKNGYIKNGSTWFNQWADFINYTDPKTEKDKEDDYRKLIYRDEK